MLNAISLGMQACVRDLDIYKRFFNNDNVGFFNPIFIIPLARSVEKIFNITPDVPMICTISFFHLNHQEIRILNFIKNY